MAHGGHCGGSHYSHSRYSGGGGSIPTPVLVIAILIAIGHRCRSRWSSQPSLKAARKRWRKAPWPQGNCGTPGRSRWAGR